MLGLVSVGIVVAAAGIYYFMYGVPFRDKEQPPPLVSAARFTHLEGSVMVKAVKSLDWRNADGKMALGAGDLIRTGPSSVAEITFEDDTVVRLSPGSVIAIEPPTEQQRVAYGIISGGVDLRTASGRGPRRGAGVGMPSGRGTVAPSSQADFTVEGGFSDVRVKEGGVDVQTTSGDRVQLGPSEGMRIDNTTGKAGPKMALPGVPVLVAPVEASLTYAVPQQASTKFQWKPVPEAAAYRVYLDRNKTFNAPVVSDVKATSVGVLGLEVGNHFWCVAALASNGVPGRCSPSARVSIAQAIGAPPSLVLDSIQLHTNILQVKGTTNPGATVTINGQRLKVEGDGSFSDFIALADPGKQVVVIRAKGLDSELTTEKRVTVDVRTEG